MLEEVIVWLKTTIPGIIILGALGSIGAAAVIYLLTKVLPAIFGYGSLRITNHIAVFDKAFSKRQHNFLLAFLAYHITHTIIAVVFGSVMCLFAYVTMNNAGSVQYSTRGIFQLSAGIYFLFWGIYHVYIIDKIYEKKVVPLVDSESRDTE